MRNRLLINGWERLLAGSLFAVAVAVAGLAPKASAQYMYLDANGNGVHDAGDKMNGNATPTTVDVYIDTNHNRDGSDATCDSGPEALTMNSYVVEMAVVNGRATFSGFVNQQPTMTTSFLEVSSDSTYKNGFGQQSPIAAGIYKLCTVTITGQSGAPRIDIVDLVEGTADLTSFGGDCFGNDFDNTYKLVGGSGIGTDWHDTDGLAPAVGTPVTGMTWGKIKELYR